MSDKKSKEKTDEQPRRIVMIIKEGGYQSVMQVAENSPHANVVSLEDFKQILALFEKNLVVFGSREELDRLKPQVINLGGINAMIEMPARGAIAILHPDEPV